MDYNTETASSRHVTTHHHCATNRRWEPQTSDDYRSKKLTGSTDSVVGSRWFTELHPSLIWQSLKAGTARNQSNRGSDPKQFHLPRQVNLFWNPQNRKSKGWGLHLLILWKVRHSELEACGVFILVLNETNAFEIHPKFDLLNRCYGMNIPTAFNWVMRSCLASWKIPWGLWLYHQFERFRFFLFSISITAQTLSWLFPPKA